jgi:hypothetical protein
MTSTHNRDYTALYQEIADYVIIKAHAGDPLFEQIFVSAWNKSTKDSKFSPDSEGNIKWLTEKGRGPHRSPNHEAQTTHKP